MNIKNLDSIESLEKKFGPMTVGLFLRTIRESDELTHVEFAKLLKLPELTMIKLSLQDSLRHSRVHYNIELTKAA